MHNHIPGAYSSSGLAYTRIGLGDPNNNRFYFHHCQLEDAPTSCFHILKESNEEMSNDNCYNGDISLEEIEDYEYKLNESLVTKKSKNNRVLMSRTNNLMPHFVDNLIKYSKIFLQENQTIYNLRPLYTLKTYDEKNKLKLI